MKRITKNPEIKNLSSIKIFREDIEYIFETIRASNNFKEIKLIIDDYEIDSPALLPELCKNIGQKVNTVTIKADNSLSIKLNKTGFHFFDYFIYSDKTYLVGNKIRTYLLENNRRKIRALINDNLNQIAIILPVLTILPGVLIGLYSDNPFKILDDYLFSVIVLVAIFLWMTLTNNSKIYIDTKSSTSFWLKNKDELIRDIIVGILLLIVGYFLGKIT